MSELVDIEIAAEPAVVPEPTPPVVSEPVRRLVVDGVELVLLGTAHVSQASVELVRDTIAAELPDRVCLELDADRHAALRHRKRWEDLDLKEVIKRGQVPTLLVSLLLASWQRRLGTQLGIEPGAELRVGAEEAEARGIPIDLVDRDVRITVRRAASAMSFWGRSVLMSELLVGLLDPGEASAEEIEKLKDGDVLSSLLDDLGARHPAIKRVLIDERDSWLATRILEVCATPGLRKVVAVVGAGHLAGIERAIAAGERTDLAPLAQLPPPGIAGKVIGWSIPAVILGSLGWIGYQHGIDAMLANAQFWVLATGIPGALGALAALAHPLTILAAFLAAPFTALSPVVGVGHVTALVEAWLRPPRVRELESVADDASKPSAWWRNRLLRVLLAFILPSLGTMVGTFLGGAEILSNLR